MPHNPRMHTVVLFSHIGSIGKTTLAINIADAFVDLGYKILLVDAAPQCTLTSFYLSGKQLCELLGDADNVGGGTIWSAIKPVVDGNGPLHDIEAVPVGERAGLFLCPGDVLLANYDEALSAVWAGSFTSITQDYDIMSALPRAVRVLGKKCQADIIIYDIGPGVGPLNQTVFLDSDFFATPVASDLLSLRALSTSGSCLARWIRDWRIRYQHYKLFQDQEVLLGHPVYLGYITTAKQLASGRLFTHNREYFENTIATRVESQIVEYLKAADLALTPYGGSQLGRIQNFESLVPQAHEHGVAIAKLNSHVNPGYHWQITEAKQQFGQLAREMVRRMAKS